MRAVSKPPRKLAELLLTVVGSLAVGAVIDGGCGVCLLARLLTVGACLPPICGLSLFGARMTQESGAHCP